MLVIPAIEIQHNRCLRTVDSDAASARDVYSNDPSAMALLWRKENAKTIHVTDYDGLYKGVLENVDDIVHIVQKVEIPVQLVTRFADIEECRMWLERGVYRIIVHDLIQKDEQGLRELVKEFGPSRISAGIITRVGHVCATWRNVVEIDSVEFAQIAKSIGMTRLFFTDREYEGVLRGPNFEEIRRLATEVGIRITVAGGVASVEHLWMLQDMEQIGVDSVVIGRAFYENRFPCQQLWRDVEHEQRMEGTFSDDKVSTSVLAPHPPVTHPQTPSQEGA
jgi:phosphoribosylformimino-5-aminoimidazole carboxamide ribotide isomerase